MAIDSGNGFFFNYIVLILYPCITIRKYYIYKEKHIYSLIIVKKIVSYNTNNFITIL